MLRVQRNTFCFRPGAGPEHVFLHDGGGMVERTAQKKMRMKELSRAAGVPKGTILYYIKEGLVPRPVKTHANMAYYSDVHLRAIRFVKELQGKRFLPLSVIKRILKGSDLSVDELKTLIEIDGKLFRNLKGNPDVKPVPISRLAERTGASLQEIRDLERLRIVCPIEKGKKRLYDEDDIRMVECWVKLRKAGFAKELGFDAEILTMHRDLLRILVEEEAKTLLSRVAGRVDSLNLDLAKMVEEATGILNTMMAIMHKRLIVETARKYTEAFRQQVQAKQRP
mgnify:FL=1